MKNEPESFPFAKKLLAEFELWPSVNIRTDVTSRSYAQHQTLNFVKYTSSYQMILFDKLIPQKRPWSH